MNEYNNKSEQSVGENEIGFSVSEENPQISIQSKDILKDAENSETTIRRVLSSYDLGNKLRQLRLKKKIALVDLGKHTGLSASMISQLENGKLVPTLPTLARIAMVFDVGLDYFFTDKKRKRLFSVVRAKERMQFPERSDSPTPGYFFECLAFSAQDKSLQAYLAEFPLRSPNETVEHMHEGAEFFHVIEGSVAIRYQDEEYVMDSGDSVYFDSSAPHAYRGVGTHTAKAIVITTPPRV
jgi:transcriptional regulator with XRE-family HTH domain